MFHKENAKEVTNQKRHQRRHPTSGRGVVDKRGLHAAVVAAEAGRRVVDAELDGAFQGVGDCGSDSFENDISVEVEVFVGIACRVEGAIHGNHGFKEGENVAGCGCGTVACGVSVD